jgi:hypothetical protein
MTIRPFSAVARDAPECDRGSASRPPSVGSSGHFALEYAWKRANAAPASPLARSPQAQLGDGTAGSMPGCGILRPFRRAADCPLVEDDPKTILEFSRQQPTHQVGSSGHSARAGAARSPARTNSSWWPPQLHALRGRHAVPGTAPDGGRNRSTFAAQTARGLLSSIEMGQHPMPFPPPDAPC